ncbi:hypothetical protein [uncultured Roseobacter sp.]|uniref:hypothetical protein n=1 Tax=uncultured Roseobacter sp. TaxID=114847 RepID=UPI00261DCCFE|nr:hypothetical protein [uncultured Roseobacter sp.]
MHDLDWHETDGAWRVRAVLYPKRVSFEGATATALLRSFCGALVTALPGKPTTISRHEIYRTDLNVYLEERDDPDAEALFPSLIPVPVREGTCISNAETVIYHPTYPGALAGWEPTEASVVEIEGKAHLNIVFEPVESFEPELAEFSYQKACQAVLEDPLVTAAALPKRLRSKVPEKGTGPLFVTARVSKQVGSKWFGFATHRSNRLGFIVSSGACVPMQDGSAT